jgi:hypothetical protein
MAPVTSSPPSEPKKCFFPYLTSTMRLIKSPHFVTPFLSLWTQISVSIWNFLPALPSYRSKHPISSERRSRRPFLYAETSNPAGMKTCWFEEGQHSIIERVAETPVNVLPGPIDLQHSEYTYRAKRRNL